MVKRHTTAKRAKAAPKVTATNRTPKKITPGHQVLTPGKRHSRHMRAALGQTRPAVIYDPRQLAAYAQLDAHGNHDQVGKLTLARWLRSELRSRRAEEATARRGSYRAALNPRRRTLTPFGGSGDSHTDDFTRRLTRELSRDLDRNAGAFKTINDKLVQFLVGDGVRVRPTTADPDWNKKAAELYNDHFMPLVQGGLDARQMESGFSLQGTYTRHFVVDGDVGGAKLANYRLQLFEADQIASPGGASNSTDSNGIDVDEFGAPVKFYGCPYDGAGGLSLDGVAEYTPDQFLFSALPIRKSQTRGMPLMTAVLDDFERADSYIESEIIAAEVSSQIWCTFDYPEGQNPQTQFAGTDTSQAQGLRGGVDGQAGAPDWVPSAAGSVLVAPNGMRANPYNPSRPNRDAEPFLIYLHRGYCGVAGLPYELVFNDLRGLSWSTAKGIVDVTNGALKANQVRHLAAPFSKIYLWKIQQWMKEGKLAKRADWMRHEHEWPTISHPDPEAMYTANQLGISTGQTSRQRLYGSRAFTIIDELGAEIRHACKVAKSIRDEYPEFPVSFEHLIGGLPAGSSPAGAVATDPTKPALPKPAPPKPAATAKRKAR